MLMGSFCSRPCPDTTPAYTSASRGRPKGPETWSTAWPTTPKWTTAATATRPWCYSREVTLGCWCHWAHTLRTTALVCGRYEGGDGEEAVRNLCSEAPAGPGDDARLCADGCSGPGCLASWSASTSQQGPWCRHPHWKAPPGSQETKGLLLHPDITASRPPSLQNLSLGPCSSISAHPCGPLESRTQWEGIPEPPE